jgi:hypothetical protein
MQIDTFFSDIKRDFHALRKSHDAPRAERVLSLALRIVGVVGIFLSLATFFNGLMLSSVYLIIKAVVCFAISHDLMVIGSNISDKINLYGLSEAAFLWNWVAHHTAMATNLAINVTPYEIQGTYLVSKGYRLCQKIERAFA